MEKKKVVDIQQLINNRADDKLKRKVSEINNFLCNGEGYELLKNIRINVGTAEKPKNISLAYILSSDGLKSEIIEKNIERYREEETKYFLNKVDSIRDDVDAIMDNLQN